MVPQNPRSTVGETRKLERDAPLGAMTWASDGGTPSCVRGGRCSWGDGRYAEKGGRSERAAPQLSTHKRTGTYLQTNMRALNEERSSVP